MARKIATNKKVDRSELVAFLRGNNKAIVMTTRDNGLPQMSPVAYGVDAQGRIVISTYPDRAKAVNARKRTNVSLCTLGKDFDDPWVQVNGQVEVIDIPESIEPLVEYFRSISGEHPDWEEYRQAMAKQNKSLLRITIDSWGPIATGGFPENLAN